MLLFELISCAMAIFVVNYSLFFPSFFFSDNSLDPVSIMCTLCF
jgi:hypothetical protein